MFESTREFVDLLCRLKISPNQFLICMLVNEKDDPSTIKYYEENKKNRFKADEINYLVDNGFLLRIPKLAVKDKQDSYDILDFIVTSKFSEGILVDEFDAGEEFWNAYPSWLFFNNSRKPAKAVDKDELTELYLKAIGHSKKKHNEIMKTLAQLTLSNKGYATMTIKNFVGSRHWEQLKEDNNSTGDLIRNV